MLQFDWHATLLAIYSSIKASIAKHMNFLNVLHEVYSRLPGMGCIHDPTFRHSSLVSSSCEFLFKKFLFQNSSETRFSIIFCNIFILVPDSTRKIRLLAHDFHEITS